MPDEVTPLKWKHRSRRSLPTPWGARRASRQATALLDAALRAPVPAGVRGRSCPAVNASPPRALRRSAPRAARGRTGRAVRCVRSSAAPRHPHGRPRSRAASGTSMLVSIHQMTDAERIARPESSCSRRDAPWPSVRSTELRHLLRRAGRDRLRLSSSALWSARRIGSRELAWLAPRARRSRRSPRLLRRSSLGMASSSRSTSSARSRDPRWRVLAAARARQRIPLAGIVPAHAGRRRVGDGLSSSPWCASRVLAVEKERGSFQALALQVRVFPQGLGVEGARRGRRGVSVPRAARRSSSRSSRCWVVISASVKWSCACWGTPSTSRWSSASRSRQRCGQETVALATALAIVASLGSWASRRVGRVHCAQRGLEAPNWWCGCTSRRSTAASSGVGAALWPRWSDCRLASSLAAIGVPLD